MSLRKRAPGLVCLLLLTAAACNRNTDFDAYVPYIEMGLNSYYDGDVDKAIEYTLKAKEIRPNSALAESNLAYYFEEKAKTEKN